MDVDLLNVLLLLAYVGGLSLALIKVASRRVKYALLREPPPALLNRDLFFLAGLAFPFLAILIVRVVNSLFPGLGLSAFLAGNQAWYLLTGLPAIVAVWAFVYYEYFRIERTNGHRG